MAVILTYSEKFVNTSQSIISELIIDDVHVCILGYDEAMMSVYFKRLDTPVDDPKFYNTVNQLKELIIDDVHV